MLILLAGCFLYPELPSQDTAPFYEGETRIDEVAWGCSADEGSWTVAVLTQGWTAGGLLSMSDDGLRFESHEVLTLRAARDGSWEELQLDLDIAADPALAEPGRSTRYLCNAATRASLSWRLVVFDPDDDGAADCRVWGPELDWNALAGYSRCDTRLE